MSKQPHYDSLSPKRKRFVDKYIQNGGNQSQAYKSAGYAARTSSAIRTGASNLRNNPDIVEAIKERVQPDEIKRLIDNKMIMKELLSIAKGEPRTEIKEDESYTMTPTVGDQLNAISTYHKIIPIEKEYLKEHEEERARLELELIKSQIEMNNARIGMAEEEEDRIGKDILDLEIASLKDTRGDSDDED